MAIASDRYIKPLRRICFALVLLIQLAWIFPCTYFLLSKSSPPRLLILQDRNVSKRINTLGFSGPIKALHEHEVSVLYKIHGEWSSMWPLLRKRLSSKGFVQLAVRTCFLWVPECFSLAKHEGILQIVKEAIGPRVLLYGVTVWKGKDEALQGFHRNAGVADCNKLVDFVYGANVQFISKSHMLPERLLQIVLKNLVLMEKESLRFSSDQAQFDFMEKTFMARVKKMIKSPNLWLENLSMEDGYGAFFHGGTLYRIGETLEGRAGLLLQFASADCKLRDEQGYTWGSHATSHSLYMPPTLLVAGDRVELGAVNDVRLTMVKDDSLLLKLGDKKEPMESMVVRGQRELKRGTEKPFHVVNLTVFSEAHGSTAWQEEGVWRFRKVGEEASTAVMARCRIEHFLSDETTFTSKFRTAPSDGNQVIVVLAEGMLCFRATKDGDMAHYELLELRVGSAVYLSKQLLYALVPLDSEAEFMSFYWVGHVSKTQHGDDDQHSVPNVGVRNLSTDRWSNGLTQAVEGCTVTLTSGQAYDPENSEYCDVVIFVVDGYFLHVLPSNIMLQAFDVLLIPAYEPCVLWNTGGSPVKFFAMRVCGLKDDLQVMMSFGSRGRVF